MRRTRNAAFAALECDGVGSTRSKKGLRMKMIACISAALALLSLNSSHAEKTSSARPLLQRVFRSNSDLPVNEVSCSLYSDRLVVERRAGDLKDVQESRIDGLSGDFAKLIAEAGKESIALSDGPASDGLFQWIAFTPAEGKTQAGKIVLKSTGSKVGSNSSAPAQQLVQFINLHCRACYLDTRGYPYPM